MDEPIGEPIGGWGRIIGARASLPFPGSRLDTELDEEELTESASGCLDGSFRRMLRFKEVKKDSLSTVWAPLKGNMPRERKKVALAPW